MFILLLIIFYSSVSAAFDWQFGFQSPATELMESVSKAHFFIMSIIFAILILIFVLLIYIIFRFRKDKVSQVSKVTHSTTLEIIWTVIPVIIVMVFAVENLKLIRMQENIPKSELTLKVIGHQWYWHYQYPEYKDLSFDSYIKAEGDLQQGM